MLLSCQTIPLPVLAQPQPDPLQFLHPKPWRPDFTPSKVRKLGPEPGHTRDFEQAVKNSISPSAQAEAKAAQAQRNIQRDKEEKAAHETNKNALVYADDHFDGINFEEVEKYKSLTGEPLRSKFHQLMSDRLLTAQMKGTTKIFIAKQLTWTEEFWNANSPQMAKALEKGGDDSSQLWRQKLLFMSLIDAINYESTQEYLLSKERKSNKNIEVLRKILATIAASNKPLNDSEINKFLEEAINFE